MSSFLEQMAAGSRERVEEARRRCSEAALLERARALPAAPRLMASPARFDLIAELKLRSPAVGQLKSGDEDVAGRVTTYARAGAAAVSVLTEPSRFDGSMAHLESATKALAPLNVPAMRKDFLVDPYQVIEARVAGAGGVLVIIRMLPRAGIEMMLECAREMGLFVLLEAFDEADIEAMHEVLGAAGARDGTRRADARTAGAGADGKQTAAESAPILAGLNCRDLATLQIVPSRLIELAHLLPAHVPRVAESGVVSAQDAARVAEAGYEFALVGSALMQGGDPHALAAAMLKSGRESARGGAGPGDAGVGDVSRDGARGDAGRGDVSRDGARDGARRDKGRGDK
jgi:indole-3-glycerol phosphate synthase